MYKDIVLLDGISQDYLQSVINFIEEWESYSTTLTISTSGSTGVPKPIEFNKEQVKSSAKYTGQFFDFKKGDALLLNLSPQFVAGKLMIVRALMYEMKIIVAPLNSNPLSLVAEPFENVKLGAFVPYQIAEILSNPASKKIYQSIENVIIGGTSISKELEEQVSQLSNKNYSTFGMTETLTHFALRQIDGKTDFYTCLPGIKIKTDDRDCLVVEPNNILKEPLITNDSVELIDETKFKWKGRIDNVINSGGVKIFPETDEKLLEHLFVSNRFYLSSRANEKLGNELVLVVEGAVWDDDRQQQILAAAKELLPRYHVPRSIIFLTKFEETSNGKVRRKKF